ncbi:MAG: response regulator transcription factor [SAR202 cluster bacterium]|nr:response regulator transcription factor [SAR202 cluster bacterium]
MRVMLVDDRSLMRDGVASLLRSQGHEVAGEASNGQEALDMVAEVNPDLILMDIRMPVMGGLEATRAIKARYPDTKIVMLTVSDDENDLFESVKSGAHGYLLKDLEAAEFFEALDAIQRGEGVVPTRLAGNLLKEFRDQAARVVQGSEEDILSAREHDVLNQVAQGLTNKEVADQLFISENTVKYHMKNILDKLHLRNRAQVIAWAARHSGGGS